MLNNLIANLRDDYFNAIMELNDESDIINALPMPEYESFFPIINGLIKKLDEKADMLNAEIKELNNDDDLILLAKEEFESIKFKKNVCLSLLEKANNICLIEESDKKCAKKQLTFAQTGFGNIRFERDLKDIPEEYYGTIFEMLQSLESGITEENKSKARLFVSSSKLSYIHEIKEFKVRITYRIISENTLYIMLVKMKKSDNDKLDREEIVNRKKSTQKDYDRVERIVSDSKEKEKLFEINEEIKNRIYNNLNTNRRDLNARK